jgi:serine/threonine-protein kinase
VPPRVRRSRGALLRRGGAIVEGHYVIRGFLDEGGMARVYLAEDTRTSEEVALKILRREHAGNAASRERFLREVDVAASLTHPNIARILDAGERADKRPFLVLECLSGEPMGDVLERERRFEEPYALELTRQAASALAAAHRAGVVHRDVKPDSLFLVVDGGLKVVDFGFAKLQEGSETESGTNVGTVGYMAPEQALADPIDGRTDVYGLGVTLFFLVTGTLPFDGANDAKLVAAHLHTAAPLPSSRRQGLDPRLDHVVLACLRKHGGHRYASMTALLEDLERLLGLRGGAIAAPPLTADADVYEPESPMAKSAAASATTGCIACGS